MSEFIPLSVPSVEGNEWTYVRECLDTGWVSSVGSFVTRFEQEFATYTGARHAIATVNGTAALHVALQLAGVQPGDEVLVPTLTFIASINAIQYCNAVPVFMDSDDAYTMDVEKVRRFIGEETEQRDGSAWNRRTQRRIGAIMPVHVFGNACDLDGLAAFCTGHGIPMVEDATESLGTRYVSGTIAGRHTGTVGTVGCFSFNGNKIMTTGGGGMIVTDDAALAARARYLTTQAKDDEKRFVHGAVGYNYRLTNVQAAMGVAQLERMPAFLAVKREHFDAYARAFESIPGLTMAAVPSYADNNRWMYAMQIDPALYGRDREQTMAHLEAHGIQSRPVWHLNHLQTPYRHCEAHRIERAPELLACTLNIPCSTNLTADQRARVIEVLRLPV